MFRWCLCEDEAENECEVVILVTIILSYDQFHIILIRASTVRENTESPP